MAKIVSAGEIESPTFDENLQDQVSTLDSRPSRIIIVQPDRVEKLLQELIKKRQSELVNYSFNEK